MAQAVERTADNREVLGSNPSGPIIFLFIFDQVLNNYFFSLKSYVIKLKRSHF